jgi:hypothetical protein
MQKSLIASLPVMKRAAFNTTRNKTPEHSPRPKKARMYRSQFKTMLVCFLDHINSMHKDKRWINSVTWKCWQDYGNLLGAKDPNSDLTSGFSTMPMPLHIMSYEFANSWLRNPLQKMNHPPYSLDLAPAIFGFPNLKKIPEGTDICWHSWHPSQRVVTSEVFWKIMFKTFRQ